jgi:hypothetical protein
MMTTVSMLKDRSPRWVKDAANLTTRKYAVATASWRPPPDFLVIGTKRGGTTSLFNYLTMHPGVLGLFPQPRTRKSSDYFFKQRHRGEAWYRSHFHTAAYRSRLAARLGYPPIGGEASPYYLWDPRSAAAARAVAPGVKAIAVLRDPVERAWSHYKERRQNGTEPLDFMAALEAEENRLAGELDRMLADPGYYSQAHDWYAYRARGEYLPQLQNWCRSYPAEQLLVLRSEDLYADVQGTFDRVCDFLGIPRYRLPEARPFNATAGTPMPDDARRHLSAHFASHNRLLEDHLGRELDWAG